MSVLKRRVASFCRSLLCKRQCVLPTLRGWLLLVGTFAAVAIVLIRGAYSFLTVVDPQPGGVLVVEGWASDYIMKEALAEFRRHSYAGLFVTGGTLERGAELARFKTQAEVGAAVLVQLGMDPKLVQAVPAEAVRRDRTYASALELRRVLESRGLPTSQINILTGDTHSRRTRLLFEKAFGNTTRVGVVGICGPDYDPARWWASSDGFRSVIDELVAYTYARFWFRTP